MVFHEILMKKLRAGGIKDKALDSIVCYFDNGTLWTKANNINSSIKQVPNGVPEGPLIFINYINDLIELTFKKKYSVC